MSTTKYAQAIKNQLAITLEKMGSSLQEFEKNLENLNTGEGVLKVAEITSTLLNVLKTTEKQIEPIKIAQKTQDIFDIQKIIGNTAGSLPELAFKGSLAAGALGGLTMDDMDASVDRLNKSLEREREKLKLVQKMTNNLKKEHGLA